MSVQLLTIISTLAGTILGSSITVISIVLNNHYLTSHDKTKRKRALLGEIFGLCLQAQKFCITAMDGVYPINEFSFEPLQDIKDRIFAIVIMDFEEKMADQMNEYLESLSKFQISIEEFHSLFVANPSVDDPLNKSKREKNIELFNDSTMKGFNLLILAKEASQKI